MLMFLLFLLIPGYWIQEARAFIADKTFLLSAIMTNSSGFTRLSSQTKTSVIVPSVLDEEKKFSNLETRSQCYKTLYVCNLRMILISQSVCPLQAFPAQSNICGVEHHSRVGSCLNHKHQTRLERLARDKHSSLLGSFVNYGRKKLYNIDTRLETAGAKRVSSTKLLIGNAVKVTIPIFVLIKGVMVT